MDHLEENIKKNINKERRRRILLSFKKSVIFTLLMLFSVFLFSQEKKENLPKKYIGYIDKNNDGVNDLFQDANGDGINDITGKLYKFLFEFIDKNNDGINDFFQDANGDGINDLKPYFEDKDGDGINDNAIDADKDGINDITGKPTTKQGELFIDEDGDGINDLYFLKEGKDFRFKYYEKEIKRFKRYRVEKKRKGGGK